MFRLLLYSTGSISLQGVRRRLNLLICVSLGVGLAALSVEAADGFGLISSVFAAPGATIPVTTTTDELNSDGDCSLREALQAANTNAAVDACGAGSGSQADSILLPAGTYTLLIAGANEDGNATGDLDATDAAGLSLSGAGPGITILDANGLDRALHAITGTLLTLSDLTVQNGYVTGFGSFGGGGVYFGGPGSVSNMTFTDNSAYYFGGGAYFTGTASMTGTTFINNTAGSSGGGAYFDSTASVTGTTFLSNTAGSSGGGAYFGDTASVTGANFTDNNGGGAIFFSTASVIDTIFTGNAGTIYGGGAFFNDLASVTGATFTGNTANSDGGGAYFGGPANLTDSTFTGNTANYSGGGGAVFYGTANVTSTIFMSNTAGNGWGGGAFFGSPASLTGATFTGNTANNYGGGAYFFDTTSVIDTTFTGNIANNGSGGGAAFNATASVIGTTFMSNTASSSSGGGAWFLNEASVIDTTFTGNTANNSGGGAHFHQGPASLTDTTFTGNTAYNGNGGGANFQEGTASVTGTTFTGNMATYFGGGAAFIGPTSMTATTFTGNSANFLGGGAYFQDTASLTGATFADNSANDGGGAYLYGGSASTGQFINVLFTANHATGAGMALYAQHANGDDTLTLLHTTVASPTVGLGAAVVVSGTAYLTNTLVASYTVGIESRGGTVSEDYTLFSGVATPYSGTITSGGHSITGTASFYDTTVYRLTAVSVAVDAGVNAGVATDFESDPRPSGSGFDIGWDEMTPISGLSGTNSSPTPLGTATFFTATVDTGSNVTYQWNFGDGSLGSGTNPTHTYTTVGNYSAIVTATNSLGSVSTSTLVTITQPIFKLYLPIVIGPATTSSDPSSNAHILALNFERAVWLSRNAFGEGGSR